MLSENKKFRDAAYGGSTDVKVTSVLAAICL
jgi:hypothetical protein